MRGKNILEFDRFWNERVRNVRSWIYVVDIFRVLFRIPAWSSDGRPSMKWRCFGKITSQNISVLNRELRYRLRSILQDILVINVVMSKLVLSRKCFKTFLISLIRDFHEENWRAWTLLSVSFTLFSFHATSKNLEIIFSWFSCTFPSQVIFLILIQSWVVEIEQFLIGDPHTFSLISL